MFRFEKSNFTKPKLEIFLLPRQIGKTTEMLRLIHISRITLVPSLLPVFLRQPVMVFPNNDSMRSAAQKYRNSYGTEIQCPCLVSRTFDTGIRGISVEELILDEFQLMDNICEILRTGRGPLMVKTAILTGTCSLNETIEKLIEELPYWKINIHTEEEYY